MILLTGSAASPMAPARLTTKAQSVADHCRDPIKRVAQITGRLVHMEADRRFGEKNPRSATGGAIPPAKSSRISHPDDFPVTREPMSERSLNGSPAGQIPPIPRAPPSDCIARRPLQAGDAGALLFANARERGEGARGLTARTRVKFHGYRERIVLEHLYHCDNTSFSGTLKQSSQCFGAGVQVGG